MWNLMFNGDLVTGFNRPQVVENLAKRSKKSPEWVAQHWFTGKPVRIETVESEQEAAQWRRDFAREGALLMVLPADEDTPGGSRYAGADPANTRIEEPTLASVTARIPAIRRRNQAFMVLGGLALILVVVLAAVMSVVG